MEAERDHMNATNLAANYTRIQTTSKTQLLIMLYEGAIKFSTMAINDIAAGDIPSKRTYITKTINILNELNHALDHDMGGDIAEGLESLYLYMINRLVEANLKSDPQMIKEVIELLRNMKDTWEQAIVSLKSEPAKEASQVPHGEAVETGNSKPPARVSVSV